MSKRATWWILAGVLGLAVVVGAGAMTYQRRQAQAEAQKKGAKPALEFAQADVARLQERRLSVETELPGTLMAVTQTTVRAKLNADTAVMETTSRLVWRE